MDAIKEIKKELLKILITSLNGHQANHLAQRVDGKFNIYRESGFSKKVIIPRQAAAKTIIDHFSTEEGIVELFTQMLRSEGTRLSGAPIQISRKNDFIKLLARYKWIYDNELKCFYRDPFYENEIDFLKSVRLIDLRNELPTDDIIQDIEKAGNKLSMQDLDWRITVRMHDLDRKKEMLIRKIIELVLSRQNLSQFSNEFYICMKELAVNASKANYKLLFEKHFASKKGITSEKKYKKFLKLFKEEIDQNGNTRLLELAKKEDMFYNIIFQSTKESIAIWVTNYASISKIEKRQILKKLKGGAFESSKMDENDDAYTEGAGLGINIILSVLNKYTRDKEPLKVIFYPDFVKIGFELKNSDLIKRNAEAH